MVGDKVGVDVALTEQGIFYELAVERNGGLDAANDIFAECALHDAKGLFPIMGIGNEQSARRVVVGRELVPGADVGVQANARAAGRHVARNKAGVGGKVVLRVLAVDAHLHGAVRGTQIFFAVA